MIWLGIIIGLVVGGLATLGYVLYQFGKSMNW